MSDNGFFTDIRYPDIVQPLISDSDINRYRYMQLFPIVEKRTETIYLSKSTNSKYCNIGNNPYK